MAEEGIAIRDQSHLKERAFDEFKRFIVIFLYLWVVFGLLSAPQEHRPRAKSFGLSRACLCDY